MCIDSFGNPIVVGHFIGTVDFGDGPMTSNGSYDAFLLRLHPDNGNTVWKEHYGGPFDDKGFSVDAVPSGGVAVTGYMQSDSVSFGSFTKTRIGPQDMFLFRCMSGNATPMVSWAFNYGGANASVFPASTSSATNKIGVCGSFKGAFSA